MRTFGKFVIFIGSMFTNREAFVVYVRQTLTEMVNVGVGSVYLVSIVSTFIGAVTAVQTAFNLVSPLIPNYVIAMLVRDTTVLELAPTVIAVVFAGKVGSNMASELGTMRITEQIDAIEVMGINASSYLVLPKIIATTLTFPMLVIIASFLSILGGYIAGVYSGYLTETEYIFGIRAEFNGFNVYFALIKAIVFGFLISSISCFRGFFTKGGALEVGQSSTSAVTTSCIAILLADYLLAELLL